MTASARRAALAIGVAVLIATTLTACGSLEDAAVARDRCHELGGTFDSWRDGLFGTTYLWECDLSDETDAS